MKPVRAILFDLDGTLVDSARDLREAVNLLLAEEGLRPLSLDEVKGMVGDGVARLVERALRATGGDAARLDAQVPRFMDLYGARATRHTVPYPGVPEVLAHLQGRGLRLGVVTNKPRRATLEILNALGLAGFFGSVVAGDTLPERKPDPAPLRHALAELCAAPEEALMVGDNHHDVQDARAAGLRAVAVTYGYSHRPHGELGADALIDAMPELVAWLGLE
ncbi:phosphoglycolate phosphatase [Microvirga thermotolerans]|uniref:Phosphoglycolate phosphatase n=1 Tax=Microvirga thermotolerans TaxID=2651334 RepID=A0A5P9JRZ9_9HYPH|nr:phosphoglycolate phosphatase [Microvirga thermotolerans]QFU15143.1 phosphoglycolate phosphatase [Microvirga thermotolerans]